MVHRFKYETLRSLSTYRDLIITLRVAGLKGGAQVAVTVTAKVFLKKLFTHMADAWFTKAGPSVEDCFVLFEGLFHHFRHLLIKYFLLRIKFREPRFALLSLQQIFKVIM